MAIQWKTYLTLDGTPLRGATDAEMAELENFLGKKLPEDFRELIKNHQGQSPANLKVVLPKGSKPGLTCIFHGFCDDDVPEKIEGYGIDWTTSVAEEELEHENIVAFAASGNSLFALDYSKHPDSPEVVFIDGDYVADEEGSKIVLASSITEFLKKYEA